MSASLIQRMDNIEKYCEYCEKQLEYKPLNFPIKSNLAKGKAYSSPIFLNVFYCEPCFTEYVYLSKNGKPFIHLYVKINDSLYRWTQPHEIILFGPAKLNHIGKPGVSGVSQNEDVSLIKEFYEKDGFSIITPSNIFTKISKLLAFM